MSTNEGAWAVSLDGVVLDGGSDRPALGCLSENPDGMGHPPLRTEDVTYPQRDGVRHFNDWYEPRIITLPNVMVCPDDDCDRCPSARIKVRQIMDAWSRRCDDAELVIFTDCTSPAPGPGSSCEGFAPTDVTASPLVGANPSAVWDDTDTTYGEAAYTFPGDFEPGVLTDIEMLFQDPVTVPVDYRPFMRVSATASGDVLPENLIVVRMYDTSTDGDDFFWQWDIYLRNLGVTGDVTDWPTAASTTFTSGFVKTVLFSNLTTGAGIQDPPWDDMVALLAAGDLTVRTYRIQSVTEGDLPAVMAMKLYEFGMSCPAPDADDRAISGPFGAIGRPRVAPVTWLKGSSKCASLLLRFDAVDHRLYVLDADGTPGSGGQTITLNPDSGPQVCRTYPRCYPVCYDVEAEPDPDDGGPVDAVVTGNICAYPIITLYPTLVNPVIENVSTGQEIRYATTIGVGAAPVVIDTFKGTATQGGADRTHFLEGTRRFGLPVGTNTLRLRSFGTGDNGYATVTWRPAVDSA